MLTENYPPLIISVLIIVLVIFLTYRTFVDHTEAFGCPNNLLITGANLYDLFGRYSSEMIKYLKVRSASNDLLNYHLTDSVKQISIALGSDADAFVDFTTQLEIINDFLVNPTHSNVLIVLNQNAYDIAVKMNGVNDHFHIDTSYNMIQQYLHPIISAIKSGQITDENEYAIKTGMFNFADYIVGKQPAPHDNIAPVTSFCS